MLSIITQFQVEGYHRYENAPEQVKYLRDLHRHVFHIKAKIQVNHNDRELEFIMVKHKLKSLMEDVVDGDYAGLDIPPDMKTRLIENKFSCEDLASILAVYVRTRMPQMLVSDPGKSEQYRMRQVEVEVMEDGENGAVLLLE